MYVQHLIEILREVRRTLRKDGVCFANIGDSYAGSGSPGGDFRDGKGGDEYLQPYNRKGNGLKPKDLCLVPQRLVIAAQEDGWWVRSVIVWSKPNPMPESCRDRPSESHEYIIMLTKAAKYYWDQEAVREKSSGRPSGNRERKYRRDYGGPESHTGRQGFSIPYYPDGTGRNLRSVWEFPTKPYPGAHFAVFPEKLPETCIKAATPEVGCCSKCGAPWTPVVKKGFTEHGGKTKSSYPEGTTAKRLAMLRQSAREQGVEYQNTNETTSWRQTCSCNADKVPSLVLDPFAGSGTTGKVAKQLGRRCVMYELSEEYCRLALERNRQTGMVLT